ncbi:hypothetical protein Bhyg_00916, partial [Pseudolycoriella hygida]
MIRLNTNFRVCFVLVIGFLACGRAKNINDKNVLTIPWYEGVTPEKVEADKNRIPKAHLVELTDLYDEISGTIVLNGTDFRSEFPDSNSWRKSAGFVQTVFYSYQKHHNLVIRPDDIWTAILTQFSLYVNANSEGLRSEFVNFEGKKTLEVQFFVPINQVPVDQFIERIGSLINENIDPKIASWVTPNFTTTTVNDKLVTGASLMATLQNYFDYSLSLILCGIPEVTILGTVDDWKDIRQRVKGLTQFELIGRNTLTKWSSMLEEILDEIIKVKEGGKRNDEFWRQAIRIDYKPMNLGCAIPNENITPGVVHVPISIYDEFAEPSQRKYTGAIITGHMGHAVRNDEMTLQPMSGWAMMITNEPPSYLAKLQ